MPFPCRDAWFDWSHWGWGAIFPWRKHLHTETLHVSPTGQQAYVRGCDGNYYICVLQQTTPWARVGDLVRVHPLEVFGAE